jgi:hypothetical protein
VSGTAPVLPLILFRHEVARLRHNRRRVRSQGTRTSEAEPGAAACSPGGGQRRQTAGECEERSPVSVRSPHAPRGPRGRAETAQRGV